MEHGAAFHPRGLGGIPSIRPKPQCKLSRMSQRLTIYMNPGCKQSPTRSCSRAWLTTGKLAANLTREDNRSAPGGYGGSLVHVREEGGPRAPQCASIPRPGGRNHFARTKRQIPSRRGGGPDRAGLAELMTTRPVLTGLLACRRGASHRSNVATAGKAESSFGVTILALDSACSSHCIRSLKDIAQAASFIQG